MKFFKKIILRYKWAKLRDAALNRAVSRCVNSIDVDYDNNSLFYFRLNTKIYKNRWLYSWKILQNRNERKGLIYILTGYVLFYGE